MCSKGEMCPCMRSAILSVFKLAQPPFHCGRVAANGQAMDVSLCLLQGLKVLQFK